MCCLFLANAQSINHIMNSCDAKSPRTRPGSLAAKFKKKKRRGCPGQAVSSALSGALTRSGRQHRDQSGVLQIAQRRREGINDSKLVPLSPIISYLTKAGQRRLLEIASTGGGIKACRASASASKVSSLDRVQVGTRRRGCACKASNKWNPTRTSRRRRSCGRRATASSRAATTTRRRPSTARRSGRTTTGPCSTATSRSASRSRRSGRSASRPRRRA